VIVQGGIAADARGAVVLAQSPGIPAGPEGDPDRPAALDALVAGVAGWSVASPGGSDRKAGLDKEAFEKLERKARDRRFRKWH
jgi:hypothetical protein